MRRVAEVFDHAIGDAVAFEVRWVVVGSLFQCDGVLTCYLGDRYRTVSLGRNSDVPVVPQVAIGS